MPTCPLTLNEPVTFAADAFFFFHCTCTGPSGRPGPDQNASTASASAVAQSMRDVAHQMGDTSPDWYFSFVILGVPALALTTCRDGLPHCKIVRLLLSLKDASRRASAALPESSHMALPRSFHWYAVYSPRSPWLVKLIL